MVVLLRQLNPWARRHYKSFGKCCCPEALPTLIDNITVLIVNLISYSAMAGAIGGGGLGDIAIRYGYQRFQGDVMLATIIILIVLVQVIQKCR